MVVENIQDIRNSGPPKFQPQKLFYSKWYGGFRMSQKISIKEFEFTAYEILSRNETFTNSFQSFSFLSLKGIPTEEQTLKDCDSSQNLNFGRMTS